MNVQVMAEVGRFPIEVEIDSHTKLVFQPGMRHPEDAEILLKFRGRDGGAVKGCTGIPEPASRCSTPRW